MTYRITTQLVRCKNAFRYKGTKPPKCNGGKPCMTCLETYNGAELKFGKRSIMAKPEDFESVLANAVYALAQKIKGTEALIGRLEMREKYWLASHEELQELARCKATLVHYKRWHKLALAMADVVE